MPTPSFTESIPSFAAWAIFFCTDGVEKHALSIYDGSSAISISTLSMLGILGFLRSSLKLFLGLDGCKKLGFSLDSLRPILGFLPEESPPSGILVESFTTHFHVSEDGVLHFQKQKVLLGTVTTPIIQVGMKWGDDLGETTTLNLGNPCSLSHWSRHPAFEVLLAFLCSGMNAWALLIAIQPWRESTEWSTIRLRDPRYILAIPGLHASLFGLLLLPLWLKRQLDPTKHIDTAKLSHLNGQYVKGQPDMWLLQASFNDRDILHFTGNLTFLRSLAVRVVVLFLSISSTIAYLCQYEILGSNYIIWMALQGGLASIRALWWLAAPLPDHPRLDQTELAMINNSASLTITLVDLACSVLPGNHDVPNWAWDYLKTTTLRDILDSCIRRSKRHDVVIRQDVQVDTYIAAGFDWPRIIARRRGPKNDKGPEWRLGFIRYLGPCDLHLVEPFILVPVNFKKKSMEPESLVYGIWGWMDSVYGQRSRDKRRIPNPCGKFVCSNMGEQLHLTERGPHADANCPWKADNASAKSKSSPLYEVHKDTWKFHEDRGPKVELWIEDLLSNSGSKYVRTTIDRHAINTWDADILITGTYTRRNATKMITDDQYVATTNTLTRKGFIMNDPGGSIHGYIRENDEEAEALHQSYPVKGYPPKGLDVIREYVELGVVKKSRMINQEANV